MENRLMKHKVEHRNFVSYELAEKCKSLGFNDKCFAFWYNEQLEHIHYLYTNGEFPLHCSAPLYQQVFHWFREEHNLHSCIDLSITKPEHWYFRIDRIGSNDYEYHSEDEQIEFNTYEEAQTASIEKMIGILQHQTKTVA